MLDLPVLFAHKPSHVREEEAAVGVVGVGVGVRVLVVEAMVATPLVYVVLNGRRLQEG
jgi:hypothetical protein